MKRSLCLIALLAAVIPYTYASEALAQKAGCMGCHAKDKKLVGPSFQDVSTKYKAQKDADTKLFDKVRKGSSGIWGSIAMPPSGGDKISDGDLKTLLQWVLKGTA